MKKLNTKQNVQEPWDNYKRCNIHKMGMPGGVKKKKRQWKNRRNLSNNDYLFSKINFRHQPTHPRSSAIT